MSEPGNPEVPERARRRTFSAQYKARTLAEYERCDPGAKGALLRREGLYSSMISEWRKQRDHGALQGLATPAGRPRNDPRDQEVAKLKRDNARLQADLTKAHHVIEVQRKLSALLEQLATGSAEVNGGEPR
ncbi:MAG TPA: transposase [Chloroflexota bacterium]